MPSGCYLRHHDGVDGAAYGGSSGQVQRMTGAAAAVHRGIVEIILAAWKEGGGGVRRWEVLRQQRLSDVVYTDCMISCTIPYRAAWLKSVTVSGSMTR